MSEAALQPAVRPRKASNGTLKHSHCLEVIARHHGFKSFADMKEKADEHS
jgi:hypothetical protein